MPDRSISKWKPVIDLRLGTHFALALHVVAMLRLHFRGRVDLQKHLLAVLARDNITNGAAYAMVEHLAEGGYLRFERWGPGRRYKRILLRRPLRHAPGCGPGTALRIQGGALVPLEGRSKWPKWATQYLPGPPNHKKHIARHDALAATWGWR